MSTDVLAYLNSKQLTLKAAPGNEVHLACFFCNEPEGKRGRLYINVDSEADIPGLFMCQLCGAHGALPSIMRHFGDQTEQEERSDDGFRRRMLLEQAAAFYQQALTDNEQAFKWLRSRGISTESIEKYRLGFAGGGLYAYLREHYSVSDILATGLIAEDRRTHKLDDFLTHHITIPYITSGNVVMIRGRTLAQDDERKYVTPFGQKTRLFNTDAVWHADELVLTEGEFDCIIAEQLGYRAVASPGAATWQDTWEGFFADARRVYILFDNDVAGRRGAEKVVDKLGSKCRTVVLGDESTEKVDLTDWVVKHGNGPDEFSVLLHRSAGGLLVRVSECIAEFNELQQLTGGLTFGVPRLDAFLRPGLLPAELMTVLAATGVGKTTWLVNTFHRICTQHDDAKILFISLEQTRSEWWDKARRIYRFFNMGATDRDAELFWDGRIMLVDRNTLTPDQLVQCIEDFQYEWGQAPSVVGLDYMGYFAQSFKGERYERVSDAIYAAKGIAKDMRVPIIGPHQVSRKNTRGTEVELDDARDSGIIGETSDFLLAMWSDDYQAGKSLEDREGITHLKVHKSRHGGEGLVVRFRRTPITLAMVYDTDPAELKGWAKYEWEYYTKYSDTLENALIRHESGLTPDQQSGAIDKAYDVVHRKRQKRLHLVTGGKG